MQPFLYDDFQIWADISTISRILFWDKISQKRYHFRYIYLNMFIDAFIDVFSYNEELCNGANASGMSGKFVLQNGDLISLCLLMNLL